MNSPSCQTTSQTRGVVMFFFLSSFENIVFFSFQQFQDQQRGSLTSSHTENGFCGPILQEDRFLQKVGRCLPSVLSRTPHDTVSSLCLASRWRRPLVACVF